MHDGSHLILKKLNHDYNPRDRMTAVQTIAKAAEEKQFLTGLLYIDEDKPDFVSMMKVVDEPLASLQQDRLRPSKEALDKIMAELM
jgi:2-oxoglutarate ferredoxin oxidoreductase subunit beta